MGDLAVWIFWLSITSLVYAYAGFPLLVAVVALCRRRLVHKAPVTPTISLIIAAYNEEAAIGERLENALAADYPPDHLQIIVAADGCSDATEAIVDGYAACGVLLLSLPRRGKIPALNDAVQQATGEILVFSDANTMCDRAALRNLVRNFADPDVGGVVGHTSYRVRSNSESSSQGEDLYWSYDTWLKALESRTGSVVSAHGGLYGLRRALYRPILDAGVTDDFAISTSVIEQGYRLVFEPEARATEVAVPEAQREFHRRVRLITRGLRSALLRKRLVNPFRYGFYAVVFTSHKIVRRLGPGLLLLLAGSSAYLSPRGGLYLVAAVGQALFIGLAVTGALLRRRRLGRLKLFYIPFYFLPGQRCLRGCAHPAIMREAYRVLAATTPRGPLAPPLRGALVRTDCSAMRIGLSVTGRRKTAARKRRGIQKDGEMTLQEPLACRDALVTGQSIEWLKGRAGGRSPRAPGERPYKGGLSS